MNRRFLTALLLVAALAFAAAPASAQRRGGTAVGHAAPRVVVAPRVVSPFVRGVPFRPYFYPYRPGFAFGFYAGYPFYDYPFGYPYYRYGYGYPYGYYPPAYLGSAYGGVRLEGAPPDAPVYADGYYVGVVNDFDGRFQHLNLEPGPHRLEIRVENRQPISFEVNVRPGETITYRAGR